MTFSLIFALLFYRKKSDQKSSGLNKSWSKSSANKASPQMGKKNLGLMAQDSTTSQGSESSKISTGAGAPGASGQLLGPPEDINAPTAGASSEDLTGTAVSMHCLNESFFFFVFFVLFLDFVLFFLLLWFFLFHVPRSPFPPQPPPPHL